MGTRFLAWCRSQRRTGAVPGIVTGLAIAGIAVPLVLLWSPGSSPPTPRRKALSPESQGRLSVRAAELAPGAKAFTQELLLRTRAVEEDPSDESVQAYSDWMTAWSERFGRDLDQTVERVAREERELQDEVRRFLYERLREDTGSCAVELSFLPGGGRSFFAAPRAAAAPATVEKALEKVIQRLLALLPKLPPKAQKALQRAIVALRRVIRPFDTKPIAIAFDAPAEGAIVNAIPTIGFTMTDSGSGPDPASRKLEAINTGPVVQQTTDLTAFTQVTLNDPVKGKVVASANAIPATTIQDGFIALKASGTDFAGNTATVATLPLVLDRVQPEVAVTSPSDGSTIASTDVQVDVAIADSVSGMSAGSLNIKLNGTDVTGLLTISTGVNNPLGFPTTMLVTGPLSGTLGTNVLTISVSDAAGNITSSSSTFAIQPLVVEGIVLTKVSGDSQEIMVGDCSAPLRVRASSSTSGLPVSNLTLVYQVPQLEDVLSIVGADGFVTDDEGMAGLLYVPSKQGQHTITVSVLEDDTVSPVGFTVTAQLPTLEDVTQVGPCNSASIVAEFPGSALPRIFTLKAKRPNGTPLEGATVVPEVVDASGNPVTPSPGEFLPSVAVTDASGETKFLFVMKPDAASGPFTMRYELRGFAAEDGSAVKVDLSGTVLAFAGPEVGRLAKISDTNPGQSQIGIPGLQLSTPLRAQWIDASPGVVAFFIMEGSGTFEVVEGTKIDEMVNSCGNPIVMIQTAGVFASVKFTPSTKLALVGVRPSGPISFPIFDLWAIGPPEIRVTGINPSGSDVVKDFFKPANPFSPAQGDLFRIEVLAPNGLNAVPTLDVQSRTACGEPTPTFNNDLAPTAINNLTTALTGANERHAIYRTAPIAAFDRRLLFGDPTPTLGAGIVPLQITDLGGLSIVGHVAQEDTKRKIRVVGTGILGGFEIQQRLIYVVDNNGKVKIQTVFTGIKDSAKVAKVVYDFGDGTDSVTKEGEGKLKPADHEYTVAQNAANRRKNFTLNATAFDKDGNELDKLERPVRVALSVNPEGNPAPGLGGTAAQFQAALTGFQWNEGETLGTTPPTAFANLSGDPFANPPDLLSSFLTATGITGNLVPQENRRLIFKESFSAAFAPGTKTTVFELTVLDYRNYRVYGSYVAKPSWSFSPAELRSIVNHHEKHVTDIFHAAQNQADTSGRIFRELFEFYKKKAGIQADNSAGDADTQANRNAFIRLQAAFDKNAGVPAGQDAAKFTRVPHAFLELEPWVDQFTAAGDLQVSNRFLEKSMPQLVVWFDLCVMGITQELKTATGADKTLLEKAAAHVVTQYNKLVTEFPELRDRKEFGDPLRLPEPKFK